MNRPIKFRAWDKQREEWVYGYYYTFGERAFIIEPGKPGIPEQHIEVVPDSVGQFCGLLDKNGREAYESDRFHSAKGDWEIRFGEWKYWDGEDLVPMYGWYAECLTIEGKSHAQLMINQEMMSTVEITGNAYENEG